MTEYLTIKEAAATANVSTQAIRDALKAKKFPGAINANPTAHPARWQWLLPAHEVAEYAATKRGAKIVNCAQTPGD